MPSINQCLEGLESAIESKYAHHIYIDHLISEEHRQSSGAFYTPVAIAGRLVYDTLESILLTRFSMNKASALSFLCGEVDPSVALPVLGDLAGLRWLDMAGGTGVFALCYMEVFSGLCNHYGATRGLLETLASNLYLNDLNPQAVEVFKRLAPRSVNCFVGDALTDLATQAAFAAVLESGGFDIIMGNPPYVGERGNKDRFQVYRQVPQLGPYYEARMDLFYFFLHLGMAWLRPGGILTQITTGYFATADGATKLRSHLREAMVFSHLRTEEACKRFSGTKDLSLMSFTAVKGQGVAAEVQVLDLGLAIFDTLVGDTPLGHIHQSELFDHHGQITLAYTPADAALKQLLSATDKTLADVLEINQGVVSGMDRDAGSPVFVYRTQELPPHFSLESFKPFLKNSMIKPFAIDLDKDPDPPEGSHYSTGLWLMYTNGRPEADIPEALEALSPYRERLERRREVAKGLRQWYELQWGRLPSIFERPKIVSPQRAMGCSFAYTDATLYGSADIYFLSSDHLDPTALKAIAAYLNTPLVYAWLYKYGKRKGRLLELYATPLKRVPLPDFDGQMIADLAGAYDALSDLAQGQSTTWKPTNLGAQEAAYKALHSRVCAYVDMGEEMADALWQWYIVSIQT